MDEEKMTLEQQTDIPSVPADWAYPRIFQHTIFLNDGTELRGYIQKSTFSNRIWVFIHDYGLDYSRIVSLFSDSEKTKSIKYNVNSDERIEYIGYINLASINAESDGSFSVGLERPI